VPQVADKDVQIAGDGGVATLVVEFNIAVPVPTVEI
jgi:hypothetical protein